MLRAVLIISLVAALSRSQSEPEVFHASIEYTAAASFPTDSEARASFQTAIQNECETVLVGAENIIVNTYYLTLKLKVGITAMIQSSGNVEQLRSILASWGDQSTFGNSTVHTVITQQAMTILGVELSLPALRTSMPCRDALNGDEALCSDGSSSSLYFAVETKIEKDSNELASQICTGMMLDDCSNLIVIISRPKNRSSFSGSTLAYSTSFVLQNSPNPLTLLLNFVQKLRDQNFAFTSLEAIEVSVRLPGVSESIIYQKTESLLSMWGDPAVPCSFWWLMFLILIVPVSITVLRFAYRAGRTHGIDKERHRVRYRKAELQQLQATMMMQGAPATTIRMST